jgi:hypothetical protein
MIWGIFPGKPNVSFETHFFGATLGSGRTKKTLQLGG